MAIPVRLSADARPRHRAGEATAEKRACQCREAPPSTSVSVGVRPRALHCSTHPSCAQRSTPAARHLVRKARTRGAGAPARASTGVRRADPRRGAGARRENRSSCASNALQRVPATNLRPRTCSGSHPRLQGRLQRARWAAAARRASTPYFDKPRQRPRPRRRHLPARVLSAPARAGAQAGEERNGTTQLALVRCAAPREGHGRTGAETATARVRVRAGCSL